MRLCLQSTLSVGSGGEWGEATIKTLGQPRNNKILRLLAWRQPKTTLRDLSIKSRDEKTRTDS